MLKRRNPGPAGQSGPTGADTILIALAIRLALAAGVAAAFVSDVGPGRWLWIPAAHAFAVALIALTGHYVNDRQFGRHPLVVIDAVLLATLLLTVSNVDRPLWILAITALMGAAASGMGPLRLGTLVLPAVVFAATIRQTAQWDQAVLTTVPVLAFGLLLAGALHRSSAALAVRTWRSPGSSSLALSHASTVADTAALIAHEFMALTGAAGVRVWRRALPDAAFVTVATAGDVTPLPDGLLPQWTLESLETGRDDAVRELLSGTPARALVLRASRDGEPAAIALLGWRTERERRASDAEHLRGFSEAAADAVLRAATHDESVAAAGLDRLLLRATEQFGFSDDPMNAYRTAVTAVQEALGAGAAVLADDGRLLHGDESLTHASGAARFDLGAGATLVVEAPAASEIQQIWLASFARVLRAALERAERKRRLQSELEMLRAAFDELPIPVMLASSDGNLVASSRSFRALNIPPSAVPEEGREMSIGTPERDFLVLATSLASGRRVALLKEVTEERAALRAKDELVRTMGHELRTPLTSVRGYTQMMARNLDTVREQVSRLDALIDDFMQTTKASEGLPLHMEPVDLRRLISDAAARFEGAWEGRELHVRVDAAPAPLGDPARLAQVIDNLLSNAAKFSPSHQPVEIAVRPDEGAVLIGVTDHGNGIAIEHLEQIFERSYRIPGEREDGFGLGLAIVKNLVTAHGGMVWAESRGIGEGSTFWVRLPAQPTDSAVSSA